MALLSVVVAPPRTRTDSAWPVPHIEIDSLLPDRMTLRRRLVRELKLEAHAEAVDRARPEDTLVVDVGRRAVWFHGISVALTERLFTFVHEVALATQAGTVATQHSLRVAIAGANAASNTASMAKKKAAEVLAEQLRAAGVTPPSPIFVSLKGGYRYSGSAFVT